MEYEVVVVVCCNGIEVRCLSLKIIMELMIKRMMLNLVFGFCEMKLGEMLLIMKMPFFFHYINLGRRLKGIG